MNAPNATLQFLILGLLDGEPRSGYDLRRLFQETPIGAYSDSPGSIYPALKALESRKLVVARTDATRPLRPRQVYRPTAAGRAALLAWLREPVTDREVLRNSSLFEAKLAFMSGRLSVAETAALIEAYGRTLGAQVAKARDYSRRNAAPLPRSARLALEGGVELLEARLAWAKRLSRQFRKHPKKE